MMETKLWIALCAILVIHLGSATPDNNSTAGLSSSKTNPDPVPSSTNNSLGIPKTDPGSNTTGGLNSSTINASIIVTPEPRKNNVNTTASDATSTKTESVTHPVLSPSQSHPTTPVPTHNSTTHTTHTPFPSTSVTPVSSSSHNVSHPQNSTDKLTQSSEPVSATVTTITTTKSSTSSTSSSQNSTTFQLITNSPQSGRQSTAAQPNGRDNPHTNDLLSLNPDSITTVRDSPALDPLLAGLVSAFIIAAVIITLLLFLKLRRRSNRPAFRRLQDLPMDDMEDTPLSMYSY